jgi:hypothetical protein
MRRRRICFGATLLALGAAACTTTHVVRPLGRGNAALNASLGGPLVAVSGIPTATPVVTAGAAYGVRDDLEAFAHADATAGVFGVLHLEPGAAFHPIIRGGGPVPTVTTAASVHLLTNFSDTRVYPQGTVAAAWRVGRAHLVYAGVDAAVGFTRATRVLAGPLVGGELRLGRLGLTLESQWLAPYYDVAPTAPDWLSPGSRGYLTVLFGATYYLGGTP